VARLKRKEVGFNAKQIKEVQEYANKECEGSFNMAVRKLIERALTELKCKNTLL